MEALGGAATGGPVSGGPGSSQSRTRETGLMSRLSGLRRPPAAQRRRGGP